MKLIATNGPQTVGMFELTDGTDGTLGRSPENTCSLDGEKFLSRRHVILRPRGATLQVERHPNASNPILFRGKPVEACEMNPGEAFVIGSTRFVFLGGQEPVPKQQITLSPQEMKPNRDSRDHMRLLDLLELPKVLRESERKDFYVYACMQLRKATDASWAQVVVMEEGKPVLQALDAGMDQPTERPMSQSLLNAAVSEAPNPVTYCWSQPAENLNATAHEGIEWAICCAMDVPGENPIVFYIAGSSLQTIVGDDPTLGESALRDTTRLVGLVAHMISQMLKTHKLEDWKGRLGRFFAGPLVETILASGDLSDLAPKITEATVMFFDIRGFSLMTEGKVEQMLKHEVNLRRVLTAMTQCVFDHKGVVLRYIGDAILACWNIPYDLPGHVELACLSALDMCEKMVDAAKDWSQEGPRGRLLCGIGLGFGDVVAGSLGSDQIYAYDILGPVANLASRVEGITKIVGVPILVTGEVASRIPADRVITRKVARFRPAGMETEVDLFTVIRTPEDDAVRQAIIQKYAIYAQGLETFEKGDWDATFEVIHPLTLEDAAAKYLSKMASQGKPPRDWHGVIELTGK